MKIIIAAVVIIAALIAGVYLTKSYFDHSAAAVPLKSQIETDTKNLQIMKSSNQSLAVDIESLKAKQTQIQQAITQESAVIPTRMNPNEIISNILDAGKQNGVTIIPLSATDWTTTKVAKSDYWVFKATMDVNGTQADLIIFLKYIQDSISQYLVDRTSGYQPDFTDSQPNSNPIS